MARVNAARVQRRHGTCKSPYGSTFNQSFYDSSGTN